MNMVSLDAYWNDSHPLAHESPRERILDRLVGVSIALDHAVAEFETEAANPILPLEDDVRALLAATDALIKQLAMTLASPHDRFNNAEDMQHVTADYFWLIGEGILTHTATGWRSFRDGYMSIGAHLQRGYSVPCPRLEEQCHAYEG